MRFFTRMLSFKRSRAADPLVPTSLVAFSHLDADQQALVAQALVAPWFEERPYRRAS